MPTNPRSWDARDSRFIALLLHLTSKIDDALREDFCKIKSKALSQGRRKVLKLLDENRKSRVRMRWLPNGKVPLEKWHKKIFIVFTDIENL
jgi:hypothetical protein